MDNTRALIAKAAIDTSTLTNGGRMNPQQQEQFITFMKDYSVFLNRIGIIKMQSVTRFIDSIEVNRRAMRQQVEGTEHGATGTATPTRRKLQAVGVIMPYNISFQFMKENIEGKNINETLARLFAKQFANDTVDMAFNGDESSSDPFLSVNDGYIKIALTDSGTHKVDHLGDLTDPIKIFDKLLASIPSKYYQMYQQEDKNLIKLFVSHQMNREYKKQLQDRHTALGDSAIVEGKNVTYDGHEIVPIGFLPDEYQLATPYENLKYGIFGDSMESYHEVKPRKLEHEYTLIADFDMEIENPDVLAIGFGS